MDTGPEAIVEAAERDEVQRQARKVHFKSLMLAAALEMLVLAMPTGT